MSKLKQFLLLALLWIVTYVIFHFVGLAVYYYAVDQWRMGGSESLLNFLVDYLFFPEPLASGTMSVYDQFPMEIKFMIYAFVLVIGVHVLILKKLRKKEKS